MPTVYFIECRRSPHNRFYIGSGPLTLKRQDGRGGLYMHEGTVTFRFVPARGEAGCYSLSVFDADTGSLMIFDPTAQSPTGCFAGLSRKIGTQIELSPAARVVVHAVAESTAAVVEAVQVRLREILRQAMEAVDDDSVRSLGHLYRRLWCKARVWLTKRMSEVEADKLLAACLKPNELEQRFAQSSTPAMPVDRGYKQMAVGTVTTSDNTVLAPPLEAAVVVFWKQGKRTVIGQGARGMLYSNGTLLLFGSISQADADAAVSCLGDRAVCWLPEYAIEARLTDVELRYKKGCDVAVVELTFEGATKLTPSETPHQPNA